MNEKTVISSRNVIKRLFTNVCAAWLGLTIVLCVTALQYIREYVACPRNELRKRVFSPLLYVRLPKRDGNSVDFGTPNKKKKQTPCFVLSGRFRNVPSIILPNAYSSVLLSDDSVRYPSRFSTGKRVVTFGRSNRFSETITSLR